MSPNPPSPSELTEQRRLAQRASQGDSLAERQLFEDHRELLDRFVGFRMNDRLRARLDAADIVQDTLIEAHRRLDEFVRSEDLPLRNWLYRLAVKQLGNARVKHNIREKRSTTREERLPDRSSLFLARTLMRHSTPSVHAMKREALQQLSGLVQQLSVMDREILLLRHTEGLTYNDISEVLEITAANARQKYVRAILQLREMCADAGLQGDIL